MSLSHGAVRLLGRMETRALELSASGRDLMSNVGQTEWSISEVFTSHTPLRVSLFMHGAAGSSETLGWARSWVAERREHLASAGAVLARSGAADAPTDRF